MTAIDLMNCSEGHTETCQRREAAWSRMYDTATRYRTATTSNLARYPKSMTSRAIDAVWRQTVKEHPDFSRWKDEFIRIVKGEFGK